MIKENPVRAKSREEFMFYICEIHNIVNERIGKEIFPCEKIIDIWGQRECGCKIKKFWDIVKEEKFLEETEQN